MARAAGNPTVPQEYKNRACITQTRKYPGQYALVGRLLGLLQDFDETEVLVSRQRATLFDADAVAHASRLVFVVHLHFGGGADGLAVKGVLVAVFELSLIHI